MSKVYISGPMSGIPDYNYHAFYDAAMKLRLKGVEVVSPAEGTVTNTKMWSDYMRAAIKMLCDCDFNVRLPGGSNPKVRSLKRRLQRRLASSISTWKRC